MAFFTRDDISLYYEVHGEGYPILLIAPGGMRSAVSFWQGSEWNPITTLAPHFRVIAMDQRNAGQSKGPVSGNDGWHSYTEDQLALLDHLGIEKAHVLGGCIGGPYAFGLMQAAPDRITAAVLQQSIGFDGTNRPLMYDMFDSWKEGLKRDMPNVTDAEWATFRAICTTVILISMWVGILLPRVRYQCLCSWEMMPTTRCKHRGRSPK